MLLQQRRDRLRACTSRIGCASPLVDEDLRRADDLFLIALGEHDPLRIALGAVVDAVHHAARAAEQLLEPAAVGVVVGDRLLRHAGLRGRARDRHRHVEQHARSRTASGSGSRGRT